MRVIVRYTCERSYYRGDEVFAKKCEVLAFNLTNSFSDLSFPKVFGKVRKLAESKLRAMKEEDDKKEGTVNSRMVSMPKITSISLSQKVN